MLVRQVRLSYVWLSTIRTVVYRNESRVGANLHNGHMRTYLLTFRFSGVY